MKGEESGQEMKREIERGSRGMRGVEQMERNLEEQQSYESLTLMVEVKSAPGKVCYIQV